jgi:branched-chain amino acid transport system substrate-binding protein
MTWKPLAVGGAVLALALPLAACSSGDQSGSGATDENAPIVLGFAIGETGFMTSYDVPAMNAAQMAVEDINASGGVGGRQLEIISADTASDPAQAGNAATSLLDQGAEIIVTSCDFDQGAPAAIVAQNAGALAFSTCAASTNFGPAGIGPLAFTMATAAPVEGAAMAEWAYNDKGWKTAFSLHDDTIDFTKQTTYGFDNRFKELGGRLVGAATFKQDDPSIATQIAQIVSAKPDVIWLSSYNPGLAGALRQIRAAGITAPILSDEDLDGDTWKDAVPDLSDVYFVTYGSIYGDDSSSTINDIVARYEASAGALPDTSLFLTGYALPQAVAKAIDGAGGSTTGADLQGVLETFTDEDFLLTTTFTPEDHISYSRTLRIMQIQGGKTSFLAEFAPESTPLP